MDCVHLQNANKPETHVTSFKVYLTGIKEGISKADLHECFSRFGDIDHIEIIVDHNTQKPRGFAFVTFIDYDAVDKIVRLYTCCF